MPRKSGFQRLVEHFHTHPKGRLHEMLFWMGLGVALGTFAVVGWIVGFVGTPFALMFSVVAACLFGWAFLPQRHAPKAPSLPPKSKRPPPKAKATKGRK